MKALIATLSLILTLSIAPISAYERCYSGSYTWDCSYTCCYDFDGCCYTYNFGAVYWYIWVIVVIFILLCVCACAGGGYGYRKYYYVRRVHYPPPTTTTVVSAATTKTATTQDCPEQGDIQLVGGQDRFGGRVEVCHQGTWKTVCDRGWFVEEAVVVCTQLNYSEPSNATFVRRGCAGQGSGSILKMQWNCSEEESNLLDCNRKKAQYDCDHRRDAGVYCSGKTPDDCEEDSLRLVDGPNNASGRVEVCRFGCWGTVCDDGWDRNSSIVACRELGFETEQAIPTRGGYFSNVSSSRLTHISQTKCEGDSTKLTNCSEFKLNCTHNQEAGVICHGTSICGDGDIRLVGEENQTLRKGIVEMCYNGVWGAVCADGWNDIATDVVCNQLRYTNYRDTFADFGWENSPIMFNNIACNESHSMLLQCFDLDSIGVYDCGRNNTAGVICELPTPDNITTLLPVRTSQTTDLMSPAVTKDSQSIVLGVVGGLLAAGVITAALVIVLMVVIRKQKKITFEKGTGMDNPTYDEGCQGTPTLKNLTLNDEYKKEFQNPIYSDETDINHSPANKPNSQLQNTALDGVYFESTEVAEIFRESADNDVAQVNGANSHTANDGVIMKGAVSEGVYELPQNLDGAEAGVENGYSTFDPTYSQLEPHLGVTKPGVEIPCPPSDNDYSHLEYK